VVASDIFGLTGLENILYEDAFTARMKTQPISEIQAGDVAGVDKR
jgi:hypothetical protein